MWLVLGKELVMMDLFFLEIEVDGGNRFLINKLFNIRAPDWAKGYRYQMLPEPSKTSLHRLISLEAQHTFPLSLPHPVRRLPRLAVAASGAIYVHAHDFHLRDHFFCLFNCLVKAAPTGTITGRTEFACKDSQNQGPNPQVSAAFPQGRRLILILHNQSSTGKA